MNFKENKKMLMLIAASNILAAFYSLIYYQEQLFSTPIILWPFVPDCILATIIFGIAIALFSIKRLPKSVSALAIMGMWKYGLWTLFILIIDFRPFNPNWYLYLGHTIMILETFLLWKKFKFKPIHLAPAFGFFLANDIFDYIFGMHPLFNETYFLETAFLSFALTITLPILIIKLYSKEK